MGCGASKTGESACLVRQEPTVQPVGRMQPVAALPAEDVAAAVAAGRWKLERAANAVFRTLCGEHNLTVSRSQLAAKLKADGELEALLCNKDVANGDDMAKTMRLLMLEDEDGLHHDIKLNRLSWEEFKNLLFIANLKALFDSIDKDGSGAVTRSELAAKVEADSGEWVGLRGVGSRQAAFGLHSTSRRWPVEGGLARVMQALHLEEGDGDGKLTWNEFIKIIDDAVAA